MGTRYLGSGSTILDERVSSALSSMSRLFKSVRDFLLSIHTDSSATTVSLVVPRLDEIALKVVSDNVRIVTFVIGHILTVLECLGMI